MSAGTWDPKVHVDVVFLLKCRGGIFWSRVDFTLHGLGHLCALEKEA